MRRLAVLVLVSLSLAAQQSDSPATFKTTTNLVVVDVFVRGKNGKAVENLKKEEFTILENGKPQAIGVFEFQHIAAGEALPAATTAAPPAATTPAARANVINADSPGKLKYRDRGSDPVPSTCPPCPRRIRFGRSRPR